MWHDALPRLVLVQQDVVCSDVATKHLVDVDFVDITLRTKNVLNVTFLSSLILIPVASPA